MPSIEVQNPFGAAIGSASSFAGGYAQQSNQNRRQENDDERLALTAKHQAAVLESIDEERKIAAEDRMRLAQARGDHEAFFSALAEARPEDVDPDTWLKERERKGLLIAGRIAGRGGDPRGALAAMTADTASQYGELQRKKAQTDLSADIKAGRLLAPTRDGKPLEDPSQDPYAAEVDSIAKDLDTPGADIGQAMERLGRIRSEISKERQAMHKREVRVSQLDAAVGAAAAANLPTDALSALKSDYDSGVTDDTELDKDLPLAKRGLKRMFHSDGTVGVYPFEEADQRTAEREAVIKKMDEMAVQLAQANIEKAKAAAASDAAQGRLYDAGGTRSRSSSGRGLTGEKVIELSQKYDEMAQKAKDNGDEAGAKFYFNKARAMEMGGEGDGPDLQPGVSADGGVAPGTGPMAISAMSGETAPASPVMQSKTREEAAKAAAQEWESQYGGKAEAAITEDADAKIADLGKGYVSQKDQAEIERLKGEKTKAAGTAMVKAADREFLRSAVGRTAKTPEEWRDDMERLDDQIGGASGGYVDKLKRARDILAKLGEAQGWK